MGYTRSPPPRIVEGHTQNKRKETFHHSLVLLPFPFLLSLSPASLLKDPGPHALGPVHGTLALLPDGVVDAMQTEDVLAVRDGDARDLGQGAEADGAVGVGRVGRVLEVGLEAGLGDPGFGFGSEGHVVDVVVALEGVVLVHSVGGERGWAATRSSSCVR